MRDVAANQFVRIVEPPILRANKRLPNGGFELILESRGGFDYVIETSDDIEDWSEITTVEDVNGAVQVIDPEANQAEKRYYKAKLTE